MHSRRFWGILLLTSWLPVVCGIAATKWFSRKEVPGAGYESTAMLSSEAMRSYREEPAVAAGLGDVESDPILGARQVLESPALEMRVREVMGLGKEAKLQVEATATSTGSVRVRVVGTEPALVQAFLKELLNQYAAWLNLITEGSHGEVVRPLRRGILELQDELERLHEKLGSVEGVAGQDASAAEVQRLKQEREVAQTNLSTLKARLEMEDSNAPKSTLTILEGPTAPTRVRIPMNEAVLSGALVGVGVGVLVILLAFVASRSRPSMAGAS